MYSACGDGFDRDCVCGGHGHGNHRSGGGCHSGSGYFCD